VELKPRKPATVLLVLLLAAACGFGQDAGETGQSPRRLMLAVSQRNGTGFTADELTLISRSLLLVLQETRADLILVDPARQWPGGSDDELSALAGESWADCWMQVELSGSRTDAILRVRSFDMLDGTMLFEKTVPRRGGEFSALDLVGERWEDISAFLAGNYPPRASAGISRKYPGTLKLSIQALAGTAVILSGAGKAKAKVGTNGAAQIDLPAPGVYELRATHWGSLPLKRRLFIRGDRSLILEQEPAPRMTLDASALMAWPGVAVSWAPVPGWLFVRAGLTTYLVGLVLREDAIFSSDPLTNLDLLAGLYLCPADGALRPYLGIGGFLRFVHASGWPIHLDPLAPLGLQAIIGAEIPLAGPARFFLEYEPMLYVTTEYPDLFATAMRDTPGWAFFPQAALQLLSFRMGIRWPL